MKTKLACSLAAALTAAFTVSVVETAWAADAAPVAPEQVNISEMTRGYTYYNRPGADWAAHDKELVECAVEAAKTRSIDDQINNGATNGIAGILVGQAFGNAYNRATFAAALENCMVVKNWRVVQLADAEGRTILASGAAGVREKIGPWIGSESPYGTIMRVWNNDAAHASTHRYEIRPGRKVDGSLSLVAISETSFTPAPQANLFDNPQRVRLDKKWPLKWMKPTELGRGPAEGAVVIVHVQGMSFANGIGVTFVRMGPDAFTPASHVDQGPDVLSAVVGLLGAKKEGKYLALVVPPGRWRLAGMGVMPVVNFCLGAPSFEVKAGEVIYAGSFDMGAAELGPDLSLDGPRNWLAGAPQAATLKAAEYTNGWTGACGDNSIYALEIPGAPFREGYQWGGAALAAQPVARSTE